MLRKKSRFYESKESSIEVLKRAFKLLSEEFNLVARNFSLIDEDELETAVDLINNDIDSLSSVKQDIVDALESDSELDIFDDFYIENNGDSEYLVADCYILNSKLSKEERNAIKFVKGAVAILAEQETGRDLIRVSVEL